MNFKTMIEKAIKEGDLSELEKNINKLCKTDLGYKIIKRCKCKENTDYSSIFSSILLPQIKKIGKSKISEKRKRRRIKNKFIDYLKKYGAYTCGHAICSHYAKKDSLRGPKKEGIIFLIEYTEGIPPLESIPDIARIQIPVHSKIEIFVKENKRLFHKPIGPIQIFVYGDMWTEGRKDNTLSSYFECKKGLWKKQVGTPQDAIIRSVNLSQI